MRINVTLRRVRLTTVAVEKQKVLHIFSVCVALVIQREKRMRRIILSSVACSLYQIFPHSHKQHDFRKRVIEQYVHFDFPSYFCLKYFAF